MDAAIFPHEFIVILNLQNKKQELHSVASLVKNACVILVLCHLMYGPFLFWFQASWYVDYTFLKGKNYVSKTDYFPELHFKKDRD